MKSQSMRDPTAETSAARRNRRVPPASLDGKTVALFDIGKARGSEFLDWLELRLGERGIRTLRTGKPTNVSTAPVAVLQKVAAEADVAVIALSD